MHLKMKSIERIGYLWRIMNRYAKQLDQIQEEAIQETHEHSSQLVNDMISLTSAHTNYYVFFNAVFFDVLELLWWAIELYLRMFE